MSRTNHNSKGAGYDYWGVELKVVYVGMVKITTHRIERRRNKRDLYNGKEDLPNREAF